MSGPGSNGYDDVRRRLVERGYLQGRVERFLLRDLVDPGSEARGIARTALKAALLGAPILGALLAGAAVAGNRPLLGATDGLVLWLYFAVVSGIVLFLLDLVAASIVVATAQRRGARRSDTLRAGLLVSLPTLAYLLVLWWNRKGGGLLENLAFLASAVVATALIAWLAGLVSLAGIVGRTGQVPDRGRRAILLALLAVPAAAFVLLPRTDPSNAGSAPFDPAPATRLTVVGIDGLDGGLVEALAATEAVDGMLGAMQRGAVLPWKRPPAAQPPEMWTTLLTGMPAEAHGVREAGAQRLPGVATPLRRGGPLALEAALRYLLPARDVPTSGASRRVRTVWEIVGLKAPAAAVGFWASWPAAPPGYVVSDRVLAKLLSDAAGDRDTAPESLFDRLRHEFPEDKREIRARFDAAIAPGVSEPLRPLVWESFLIDAYAWRVAERLAGDPSLAATFVYLPGLDILRFRLGERGTAPGSTAMVEAQAALEAYVRWLDALVVAAAKGAGRTVVVADPGRAAGKGSEGFVLVTGEGTRATCVAPPIDPLDLAPTLLALSGYPASDEMPGRASLHCFEGVRERPRVPTFGRRAPMTGGAASDYDPEMIERLRSLGYVR
ncbi:MAG TPA: hypothetical protein VF139_04395 [Candidatus Polarisedimenticolaceae bacterium]